MPLELRTQTVEEYWTYFAGFGSSMVATTMVMPFYEGAAIVGVLFPIFIVTATDANPREAYQQGRNWSEQDCLLFGSVMRHVELCRRNDLPLSFFFFLQQID